MIFDELAYVVDENDIVIRTKPRGEVGSDERVRIVAIWIENTRNGVLVAQRAISMSLDPGVWGPSAAGGVKVGTSYEDAAKEELREEVGLDIDKEKLKLKFCGKMLYETEKNGKRMCAVFKVKCDWPLNRFKIEPSEVEAVKWIPKMDLVTDIMNNPQIYLPSAELWKEYLFN